MCLPACLLCMRERWASVHQGIYNKSPRHERRPGRGAGSAPGASLFCSRIYLRQHIIRKSWGYAAPTASRAALDVEAAGASAPATAAGREGPGAGNLGEAGHVPYPVPTATGPRGISPNIPRTYSMSSGCSRRAAYAWRRSRDTERAWSYERHGCTSSARMPPGRRHVHRRCRKRTSPPSPWFRWIHLVREKLRQLGGVP